MEVQRPLGIIKPDLIEKNLHFYALNDINQYFNVISMQMVQLDQQFLEIFYEEHKHKGFFQELVDYMTRTPVIVFVLEGEEIIQQYRDLIGATNPINALPYTLRYKYGKSLGENLFHGSDSIVSAEREIKLFFGE